ncbi:uncharacterized protein [Diadema setosum]|uniref:uncharacterized protein n=1 Tax=Diadema setosum TaxID=31175 RepID=UPI003B3BC859
MQSALVTGASRGIGLELVRQLASRSPKLTHIFATCRNPDNAKELQALAAQNDNVKIIQIDVQDEATITTAVKTVSKQLGDEGLNLLINNAGMATREKYDTITRKELTTILDTNLIGPMMMTQAFLPLLKLAAKRSPIKKFSVDRAAIINISSGMGGITECSGGFPGYRESKAALNMFSKSLSIVLKNEKILVFSQCPGWVQTDLGGTNAKKTVAGAVSSLLEIFATVSEKEHGLFLSNRGLPIVVLAF